MMEQLLVRPSLTVSASSTAQKGCYDTEAFISRAKFETEHDLVNFFESLINEKIPSNSIGFMREFDCSNGIADIIMFELRKDWSRYSAIGQVHPRWVFALTRIPYRKSFTAEEFAQAAGVTKQRAVIALKEYSALGFCAKTSKQDKWIKQSQPRPIVNKIYAVEAKLRDWRRALYQATRYLDFAHQSWVLLDNVYVGAATANIKEFARLNIGLSSIGSDQAIAVHFHPKLSSPKSLQKYWQANAVIANRIT